MYIIKATAFNEIFLDTIRLLQLTIPRLHHPVDAQAIFRRTNTLLMCEDLTPRRYRDTISKYTLYLK